MSQLETPQHPLGTIGRQTLILVIVGSVAWTACGGDSSEDSKEPAISGTPTSVAAPPIEVDDSTVIVSDGPQDTDGDSAPPLPVMMVEVDEPEPEPVDSAAAAEEAAQCQPNSLRATGTLDGSPVDVSWTTSTLIASVDRGFHLKLGPEMGAAKGYLWMQHDEFGLPTRLTEALEDGESLPLIGGLLFRPDVDVRAPYCIGEGSSVRQEGLDALIDLRGLSQLGQCPGEPVEGELSVCTLDDESCAGVVGMLDGEDLGAASSMGVGLNASGDAWSASFAGGAAYWVAVGEESESGRRDNGTMDQGVFIRRGEVYCFSPESTFTRLPDQDIPAYEFNMRGFSTLGSCGTAAPGDGQLTGCVR